MLKSLRIAVTAVGLAACVLLAALWVRSYSMLKYLRIAVTALSLTGCVLLIALGGARFLVD